MIHAKNYEKLSKFVKVMAKILSVPFFQTWCILNHCTEFELVYINILMHIQYCTTELPKIMAALTKMNKRCIC